MSIKEKENDLFEPCQINHVKTQLPNAQSTIESEVSTSYDYMNTDGDGNIITRDEYFRRKNLLDLVETDGGRA